MESDSGPSLRFAIFAWSFGGLEVLLLIAEVVLKF